LPPDSLRHQSPALMAPATPPPTLPRLIGMVHLGPLPGSPRNGGDIAEVVTAAVADAHTLIDAGFDAVLVENFGDAPFFPDDVPKATVAAMSHVVGAVAALGVPTGVNVLRNDALAAIAIAAATGAAFIRVNVLSGVMFTDQGTITGRAAEVARLRSALAPQVRVFADVFVKHATPPPGLTLERATADLWERSGADAIVVSGPGTGKAVDRSHLEGVAAAAPGAPLYIGSGANAESAARLLQVCSGLIVGTAVKRDGVTTAPVDSERARALVRAAKQ
jgi:membrane complex biogenesis BtpA family protein